MPGSARSTRGAGFLTSSSRSRRGAGFLTWVSLTLLVVLGVVAWSQQKATGEATLAVSRSMAGELGVSLGQSVLEEAMHRVRVGANDPASPLFELLRKPVAAPAVGQISLTGYVTSEHVGKLLELRPYKAYSYTGPQAEVVYQRQFDDLPYERTGLIHYWTRVVGAAGISESVVREVHAYQELRTVLITTPRPFDEMPVYLGRASALTDLHAANDHRGKLIAQYTRAYQSLVAAHEAATGAAKENYAKMLLEASPPGLVSQSAPPLPEEPDAHVTALWMQGQGFALEALDIAKRLAPMVGEGERRTREMEQASKAVVASPGSDGANDRMFDVGSETLTHLLGEVLRVWGFTRAFTFIPRSDPQWELWERRGTERLSYEYFRRKAYFVISEDLSWGAAGLAQPQWELLKKKVASPTGQQMELNGVVVVENDTEPLTLTGDLHGKLTIVVTRGGVVLKDLNPDPQPGDSLVVVAAGGPIDISGKVNATVVATPLTDEGGHQSLPRVTVRPEAVIRGGLFVPGAVASADWNGVVEHDDRFYSGPDGSWLDHYYVGIAPRASFRRVVRK